MKIKSNFKTILSIIMMSLLTNSISHATNGVSSSLGKTVFKLLLNILVFVFIIVITIYGTKFIAKHSNRFVNSRYMKIIDILNLDSNTKIAMVAVNKKIYILAITNNTIKILDQLLEDEIDKSEQLDNKLFEQSKFYANKNKHINGLQKEINKFLNRNDKSVDKEEKNNEKMG